MSPPSQPDTVIIGICTFRRDAIADTLASLARLDLSAASVRIIVADNDDTASAAALIAQVAARHPVPIRYIHAPARNISVARNAILTSSLDAGARYLALLDDDEIATPGWLAALLQKQKATGSAAVVGPVRARYAPTAPRWMQVGSVHDTLPEHDRLGHVTNAYTCNVLIDLTVPTIRTLRFDPARGRTGGEDTAFFHELTKAGYPIVFSPDAVLYETVPHDRATLRWLFRRRYRMGQTHASLITPGRGWHSRIAATAVAATKALACLGMAAFHPFATLPRNRALLRGALHVGAVAELVGLGRVEIYGQPTLRLVAQTKVEGAE